MVWISVLIFLKQFRGLQGLDFHSIAFNRIGEVHESRKRYNVLFWFFNWLLLLRTR